MRGTNRGLLTLIVMTTINGGMFFYRIQFRACPMEYMFQMRKANHMILVRDVLHLIRNIFKIKRDRLKLYDANGDLLRLSDKVEEVRM